MSAIEYLKTVIEHRKAEILGLPYNYEGKARRQSPAQREDSYANRTHMITWVAVGLAAFIALAGGDFSAQLLKGGPLELKALMVTLIGVSGFCLARARVNFEFAARTLRRRWPASNATRNQSRDWDADQDGKWPHNGERYWHGGRYAFALAGICYLIGAWWGCP
jgi:uncharacterized membrane protein YidH (DUF202 family)